MQQRPLDAAWAQLAHAEAPDRVLYLDTISDVDFVQRYKQQTFALLELTLGSHVLDAGCGTGDDVRALATFVGPTGSAIGIDNDPQMIAEAERRAADGNLPVQFRLGDLHRLELPEHSFDACRADRVFQHLAEPQQALAELVRVLRPGGRIVLGEPDWETLVIDSPYRNVTRCFCHFLCDNVVRNGWMGRQLRARFLEAGLDDIVVFAGTMSLTSYVMADRLWGLERNAHRAVAAGALTSDEAEGWLAELRAADTAGRFYGAATGFGARGRKPERV